MDVVNTTEYTVEVARTQLFYQDLLMATVIWKCGWHIAPTRELMVSAPPDILQEDLETDGVLIDSDVVPVKAGCDLAIVGDAQMPDGRETTQLRVRAQIGDRVSSLVVPGERAWLSGPGGGFSSSGQGTMPSIEMAPWAPLLGLAYELCREAIPRHLRSSARLRGPSAATCP